MSQKKKVMLPLVLTPVQAMSLIGQLQLALRHPENTGESALLAHKLIAELSDDLKSVHPNFVEIIAMGENINNDNSPQALNRMKQLMTEIHSVIDII